MNKLLKNSIYIIKATRKVVGDVKYVVENLRRQADKNKLPVIRIEIDYELMTLYDAIQANDRVQIIKSKERLKTLRLQLLDLQE